MEEFNFSGVSPLRVPEARRRVEAIVRYLDLPDPTGADADRHASAIGLSRIQFQRLVRVWRDHRDARLLVVGRRGPATRDYGMDERGAEITVEVIKAAGPTASLAAVAPEIERRCAAEYVLPPSRPTIWNRIRALRLEADTTVVGPPRILIGRMWFHLPVRGSAVDVMPALLAAVMLPERRIITRRSSINPARPPSVDDLVCSLAARRTLGAAGRTLIIDPHDRVAASQALDASGLHGVRACRQSVQSQVSRVFGGRLGPLHVVHRRGKARPGKRPMLRQDEALPEDEVLRLIDEGVEAHNAATPVPPPFDIKV